MRKLISLFLVLAMILSLSVTAFAEETEGRTATADKDSEYEASIDVNGKYISQLESNEIISVVVAWQDMNFIYYGSQEGTWNPTTHTYDGAKTAKWNKTTSDITVTNHSNAEVTATLTYTPSVTTVTGDLKESELTLASAAEGDSLGDTSKAPSATSTFTISGTMDSSSSTDLGTITVELDTTPWQIVSNYNELSAALVQGGKIRLANDISCNSTLNPTADFKLDLNEKKLSCKGFWVIEGAGVKYGSIANGTIESAVGCATVSCYDMQVTIDNCTLISPNYCAINLYGTTAIVRNTKIKGGVLLYAHESVGSILTATQNVTIDIDPDLEEEGFQRFEVHEECTAILGFDPSDTFENIVDNGDGTWTVIGEY